MTTGIENINKNKKNKYFAAFLAFFGGIVGLHQFYLKKPLIVILYILFFWISPIIGFIDAFLYITMTDDKWDKKYNKKFIKTNN